MNKYYYEDDDENSDKDGELKEIDDDDNDIDDDDNNHYNNELYNQKKRINTCDGNNDEKILKKRKKNNEASMSDMQNEDDNLNIIVQAVLDELQSDGRHTKCDHRRDDKVKNFHDEIDAYLKCNHTQQNSYLSSHKSFEKKLKKLMKSLCDADTRDESIPRFTNTERTIMKIFYKDKQFDHDTRFMMVENNIYLNILRKMSKYLKKI